MISTREYGMSIEERAAEWFAAKGARLLARNYRARVGEIDLIVEERRSVAGRAPVLELVFVEVRARGAGAWVNGVDSVDWRKRGRLLEAARRYLAFYRGGASGTRFDILAWDGRSWTHLPNAFGGE